MQTFVRNLCVSNKDTLHDVVMACNKILSWLTPHAQSTLSYEEVETMLKAAVYMEECIALFGGMQLLQALMEQPTGLADYYKMQTDILQQNAFIAYTISVILKTVQGEQHLPVVEEMLRQIYDKQQMEGIMQKAATTAATLVDINVQQQHQRMILAVQSLFELQQCDIVLGIDRLIAHLHFQVLGHVFLEAESSVYFARCSIVVQYICTHLTACTIPAHFIDSLQQTAAYSAEGRYFYWQCLGNICFARHLRNFCINYFQNLTDAEHMPATLQHLNTQHISYLLATALHMQSPCRLAYQRSLNKAHIIPYYKSLIQRHIIIFNA